MNISAKLGMLLRQWAMMALLLLAAYPAFAQKHILFSNAKSGEEFTDLDVETFYNEALAVIFKVNMNNVDQIDPELQNFLDHMAPVIMSGRYPWAYLQVRAAASPEGPYKNNVRLAQTRKDFLMRLFETYGFKIDNTKIEVVNEDYELLWYRMYQKNDPATDIVNDILDKYDGDEPAIKKALMAYDGGRLWKRLKETYFPELRASRFMLVLPADSNGPDMADMPTNPDGGAEEVEEERALAPLHIPVRVRKMLVVMPRIRPRDMMFHTLEPQDPLVFKPKPDPKLPRREMISIKTNALMDLAYVPQYGFCPLWNVGLEYYPRYGHVTGQVSLDIPWWQNRASEHKYFQARNYQAEARWYFNRDGVFRGWYASAYGNLTKYGIGFSAKKGWQGEGFGGGIGGGWVMPIFRKYEHLRVEFGAQAGVFLTKYDPYVYGCPVEKKDDGLYYYNWTGDADFFKKRQYRFKWLGPTRLGVTVTYDIIYRKRQPYKYKEGDDR